MIKLQRLSHIKGVLFDKDGTLFDYYRTWVPILQSAALLAARGDEAHAGRMVELAELWRVGDKGWEVGALTRALDDHFAAEAPLRSAPVTDLVAFFRGLRISGYHTGIATNDNEASALATVTRFELGSHVEFVCGYDSGYGAKPEPGMIHAFCASVGLEPSQVAMVGDNFHDLEMARRAGAGLKVGVLTGTSLRTDLEAHADIVLDSIADLPAYLVEAT